MDITFLGHATFTLTDGSTTLLVDPFLDQNPVASVKADEVEATTILLTHGHFDHHADTVAIAKRTGANVIAIKELADEVAQDDIEVADPNFGGKVDQPWGSVRLLPAWHSGTTPKGTIHPPAGLLIELGGKRVYFTGDTSLFTDLQLAKRYGRIDLCVLPIGGHYTMDQFDAVTAAEWIGADAYIPCHYDTFPPIEADAEQFKKDVQDGGFGEVHVLKPGESTSL